MVDMTIIKMATLNGYENISFSLCLTAQQKTFFFFFEFFFSQKFNAVVEDPRLRESHHAFENQNNNIISILNDACFGSELLNSLEDPTMVPLTPTQISPMSEDISGFVAVPPPPLPMDDVTTIVPRAPGDSKKGKRKSPSTPSGTGAAKRKVTTTTTTTAIKTRCGDNHSGVSRNDVAEGVVPFIHVLTQLWHDPMHRTEMCTIPVKSYRVEHRVLFRGLLKQALRESIENCLGAVTKDIDHSRAFQALAALVLHVQRGCTDVNLMTVIINGKACVKIVGKRPCGCCPVSNNLQVPSDRWDKLSCSKTTKTVLKQRK
jgi:hypothetical protein